MTTFTKEQVAEVRAKVNDALSGFQVPHPQAKKLDDLWAELAPDDKTAKPTAAPAPKRAAG